MIPNTSFTIYSRFFITVVEYLMLGELIKKKLRDLGSELKEMHLMVAFLLAKSQGRTRQHMARD